MPRWSQLSMMLMPGLFLGTSQAPTSGSASSLRAHTLNQLRPWLPVE